jgi:hypothetical protein
MFFFLEVSTSLWLKQHYILLVSIDVSDVTFSFVEFEIMGVWALSLVQQQGFRQ